MKMAGCRTGKKQYARKADVPRGGRPKKCDACRCYHDMNQKVKGRRR